VYPFKYPVALEIACGWERPKADTASDWIRQHLLWKGVYAAGGFARDNHGLGLRVAIEARIRVLHFFYNNFFESA
jgi:hypothetical protein